MYSGRAGIIFGFHGCDRSVADKIIHQKTSLKESKNSYDWLGHGMYFWENSPSRALEYAENLKKNPNRANSPIKEPCVVGAVIDLGYCLDLLDYENLQLLKGSYQILEEFFRTESKNMPANRGFIGNDTLIRELDCAVIEMLHETRYQQKLRPFDSVRGVFWEGEELYPNAGFKDKNHIQICVRNPNCIKGFFYPREADDNFALV